MANVKVVWVLPDVRKSGKPLKPEDIDHVEIQISADKGVTFVKYDDFPREILETTVTELEPGEWVFKGLVHDIQGRVNNGKTASIVVPDTTPPGELQVLTLELV